MKIGDILPDITFHTRVKDESVGGENPYRWQDYTTDDYFANKKVILFALPGAFTPTCSSTHLPRFDALYEEFKKLGIDEIYCLSVNDAFVMNAWSKHLNIKNVKFIPDGSAEFTKAVDMLVAKDNLGFGERSWRYAAIINNKKVEALFSEEGKQDNAPNDPFEVSNAETVLNYLKN
ncbi:peroxiredoxin [Bartonella sp. DGB1]|uniref:peroxiredoxin n=1 Tax=Bartonella sp. DGB1 TaxID=3239807 RepID=UPI003526AE3E